MSHAKAFRFYLEAKEQTVFFNDLKTVGRRKKQLYLFDAVSSIYIFYSIEFQVFILSSVECPIAFDYRRAPLLLSLIQATHCWLNFVPVLTLGTGSQLCFDSQ